MTRSASLPLHRIAAAARRFNPETLRALPSRAPGFALRVLAPPVATSTSHSHGYPPKSSAPVLSACYPGPRLSGRFAFDAKPFP